jgi:hypothetical protein
LANGYLIQGWQELISSTENAAIWSIFALWAAFMSPQPSR